MSQYLSSAVTAFKPREHEYLKDGVYYCGKCKSPVQAHINGLGMMRVECSCKKLEKQQAEAETARIKLEEKRQKAFERKKSRRFFYTFETDDKRNKTATTILHQYCIDFDKHRKNGEGLVLYSNQNGSGKTFLACAAANELIDKGYKVLVTDFLTLRDKLYDPKAFNFISRLDVIDSLCCYDLIVIDDFGSEQTTEFTTEIEYRIIEALTDTPVAMILTTNYTLGELKSTTDINKRRVLDRIMGNCALVSIDPPGGKSRRLEKCLELTKANVNI